MKKIIFLFSVLAITATSCTDATVSQVGGIGNRHTIELYSGGQLVRVWESTGKVQSSRHSDGYYFRDSKCKCNVEVSGDLVITRLD